MASRRASDGFALAATVLEDAGADRARAALAPETAEVWLETARRLEARDHGARRAEVRRLVGAVRVAPDASADLPPRALGLLAAEVPREVGARWMTGAPPPRRGFVASPALRDALRRLAIAAPAGDPDAARRERGAGRELLARAADAVAPEVFHRWMDAIGPEEAGAVMALRAHVAPAAPSDASWIVPLIAAAMRASHGIDPTRAIGAMRAGWNGEAGGDARSRALVRAGAELRELWEVGCLA